MNARRPIHLRGAIAATLLAALAAGTAAHAGSAPPSTTASPAATQAPRRALERAVDAPPPGTATPTEPIVTTASADRIAVSRTIEAPAGWTVGAPLRLRVTANGEGVVAVDIPAMRTEAGPFEVRETAQPPAAAPGTASMQATLVAWEAGELELPAAKAVVRRTDGTTVEVELPAAKVPIASLLGGDLPLTELAQGLRDPVDMSSSRLVQMIVTGIGVTLILAFVLWLARGRRPAVAAPPLPPDEWALREIERLEADRLPERGEVQDFFVRLSDVVRTYIERRFGIAAPEQTTQEFIRAASRHPDLASGHERTLAQFLRTADMVKFAAQRPVGTECARAMDAMRGFVRATAPATEPAPGTQATEPPAAEPPVAGGRS